MLQVHQLSLTIVLLFALPRNASATNTMFLPGDAFFHVALTTAQIESLGAVDAPQWPYAGPEDRRGGDFAGYRGFTVIEMRSMSAAMKDHLRAAVREIREHQQSVEILRRVDAVTGASQEWERNPIHLFVYDRDFDFHEYRIGAKYNETWMEHTYDLCTFTPTPELVAEDWRDATKVGPLRVQTPFDLVHGTRPEKRGGKIDTPVQIDATSVKLLLTVNKPIDIARRKARSVVYEVTEAGVVEWVARNDAWVKAAAADRK